MADASRPILDHEDQLDLLSRSALTAPSDPVVAVTRVGRELRDARELMGTQLGDASRAVNIHPSYLAAIEGGRFEDLPGRAFTIGYVARYARYLGLDVEKIVDRLQSEIGSGGGTFDDHVDIAPLPDRNVRPAVIAIALLLMVGLIYSADDFVAFATGGYEQIAEQDPAQKTIDAPTPDEQPPTGAAPLVPPPAAIAVTPPASLRADLTPAAIEEARIAAIPLPARITVTPPASLRADLTPAAIERARIAAIPLPSGIAVTPPASLRADLTPASIEEARIAAIPLPTGIEVTPPASLRADLTPAATREQTRVASLFPMPLPAEIPVSPAASLRADLEPAVVQEQIRIASLPLPTRISVTPSVSLRADLVPGARTELPPGRRYGLQNSNSRITLRMHGPAFMAVRDARGRIFLERRLARGDTYRVPNRVGLTLTARDAGAVEIILDGVSLGFAGSRGLQASALSLNPQSIVDRASLAQAGIAQVLPAAPPLPTRVSVTPQVSLRADLAQSDEAQLPSGRRYGLRNRDSRITLRVHRPTFVAVRGARGQVFLERRLTQGDTYSVPNRAGLRLTARDAGAVEIILDGDSLGFAGSRGLQASGLPLNPQAIADRLKRF